MGPRGNQQQGDKLDWVDVDDVSEGKIMFAIGFLLRKKRQIRGPQKRKINGSLYEMSTFSLFVLFHVRTYFFKF